MPSRRPHQPWDKWYGLAVWQKRRRHQLMVEPFCAICTAQGCPSVVATQVDHIVPHRGDWNAFRLGALQSLCASCHGHKKFAEAHGFDRAIGADGMPLDPRHPFYTGGKRKNDGVPPLPPPPVLIG